MYQSSLAGNDSIIDQVIDKVTGKSKNCPTPSPSSQAVSKVYKLVNYNAGRNIDSGDKPVYNMDGVNRTLTQFYKLSCQGWGYAPGTRDEMTVVNAVAKNAGVDAAIVKVILYEWYYARKRQEIYDKPFPGANTSASTSSTSQTTKPGKETTYQTPAEGGGTVIDRAKAFISEPLVWGGALVGTALLIGWKYIPKKGA